MSRRDLDDETGLPIWLNLSQTSARSLDRSLLDALPSPAAVLDPGGIIVAVNPAWSDEMAAMGADPSVPGVGSDYLDLCEQNDSPEGAMVAAGIRAVCSKGRASFELDFECTSDDESVWFRISARPLGGSNGGALVTRLDVTAYLQMAGLLADRGLRDPLTGLGNRALLMDHLQLALDRLARREGVVAVAFVDVDNFKQVNDAYGHATGDHVLRSVATRLTTAVRSGDTVTRIGGDEFVVLFEDVEEAELVPPMAQRLHDCLAEPIALDGRDYSVSASVGYAVGRAGMTPDSLVANADTAMYRAKKAGKNTVALFSEDLGHRSRDGLEERHDLRRALERRQLRVAYQPIVDLPTGRVVGVEALLRWRHPDRGVVPPSEFVPLAEALGLIVPIGRWVLEEACRQLVRWGVPNLSLSVNVSARQLTQPDFIDTVTDAIQASGIDPTRLCLELTETALMDRGETTVGLMEAIREIGPYIAIDDFGTGWSSLSYLHRLPVEILKVDRSFVEQIGERPGSTAIVTSILSLARAMGLHVIAEGVETAGQANELVRLGCSIAQGFLYAPALPPYQVATLLARGTTPLALAPPPWPDPIPATTARSAPWQAS